MDHYHQDQGQYGQYNNAAAPASSRFGGQDPALRRNSSFNTGDDSVLFPPTTNETDNFAAVTGNGGGLATYRSGSSASRQNEELFMDSQMPTSSQTNQPAPYAASGYRWQYQPQSAPPTQSAYNPQQFARTQSQIAHAPPPPAGGSAAQHSTYNPAAYQSSLQRQTSFPNQSPAYRYGQSNYNALAFYPAGAQVSASPQMSQGFQQQYPSRAQSQYIAPSTSAWPSTDAQNPSFQQQPLGVYSPGLPQTAFTQQAARQPVYNPPAPPPPPFPPSNEAFPPADYLDSASSSDSANQAHVFPSRQPDPLSFQRPMPSPPRHGVQPDLNYAANSTKRASDMTSSEALNGEPRPPDIPPHQRSPQRSDTVGRHPTSRPLPTRPVEYDSDEYYGERPDGINARQKTEEELAQESIWKEIEAAVNSADTGSYAHAPGPRVEITQQTPVGHTQPEPVFANPEENGGRTNGHLSAANAGGNAIYDAYSDESDAEAAAGLAMLRLHDEESRVRDENGGGTMFGTYGLTQRTTRTASQVDVGSDSDYANIDMGLYGGGYEGHMSYGNNASSNLQGNSSELEDQSRPLPAPGSIRRTPGHSGAIATTTGNIYDYKIPEVDSIHPFPSFAANGATVDACGTGGLAEPSPHRRKLSFDEGDEREHMPEIFFFPGMNTSAQRPLPSVPSQADRVPQLMPAGTYRNSPYQQSHSDQLSGAHYPPAPDSYSNALLTPAGTSFPRSSSLSAHSNTPQTLPPVRSKTDAEERKARLLKLQQSGVRSSVIGSDMGYDTGTPQSTIALDLPAIPMGKRKNFSPAKLSTADFNKCLQPWALSSIASWVKEMSEGEADLKEKTIVDGIVSLFTHKVPTMNTADAETLGARVVEAMINSGTLVADEEWVKFGPEEISGVLWQLTGSGCYAPKLHEYEVPGRCYSHHCSRTLKRIRLSSQVLEPQRKSEGWATFYKVAEPEIEKADKKEVLRQNILHEIVQTEDQFLDQMNVLRVLYRDQLHSWQPPIIPPNRIEKFVRDVYGKADAVRNVNEEFLLAALKYRQQEQGPWIVGFSDIFREWIRKARTPYMEYAASFPNANHLVRKEAEKNILFKQFLDQARDNELSLRLGWDTYLKAPITRLTRYGLLLATVHKSMRQDSEEKTNLQTAIDEIKAVTLECQARVAEMTKKVDLKEMGAKLILRPGMERVELNLNHLGRELIFEGDLQRMGSSRFNWLETHAILFDHYLVLAKPVAASKQEVYDVSKLPIPMDLLVLESSNDDPVVKSSVKGIGGVTTVSRPQTTADLRANRAGSSLQSPGPGDLKHTITNSSVASSNSATSTKTMVTNTVLDGPKDEKIMYPFRLKHLGKSDLYTLYAPTASSRQDWCDKILEAKTKHAASLFAQNAEPFRLRVVADTAFAYEAITGSPRGIIIKGTPLDRAICEVEKTFEKSGPRPGPLCRANVNCATAFNQPYGKQMIAIGTDYGVYISDMQNPRGWTRAIQIAKVTQLAVLEEFSLFLVIADKSLTAYHLDVVCPVSGVAPPNDLSRRAPQKLSGARDVGFFATGRMKDRTLVFFKKRDGISSTFKVLEPVFQKSTEKKSRFSRKGTTEFFREYDEFYIPTECFSINLFHSSLAVCTSRGFEVLTLDKKQSWSVPDLKQSHVATIAARLTGQRPLGMFRLSDTEFLLCYEECAVYVNKHGEVSRSVIMEFVGKAKSAALYGPYILLFDLDFVEIRNAQNGRLRQVIAGRDVRCLDDAESGGSAGKRTIKIALQHPEMDRSQLVVELLLNEGQTE
ncbi:MAG: hypothetical protein M1829_000178 [Trizodia sp. TS-e1964]|nr:MAG: hypothetical protein M1829_000178 [Trizodia sp. TS-e1964]